MAKKMKYLLPGMTLGDLITHYYDQELPLAKAAYPEGVVVDGRRWDAEDVAAAKVAARINMILAARKAGKLLLAEHLHNTSGEMMDPMGPDSAPMFN